MLLILIALNSASAPQYPSMDPAPCRTVAGRAALLSQIGHPEKQPENQHISTDISERKGRFQRHLRQLGAKAKWSAAETEAFAKSLYDHPRHQAWMSEAAPLVQKAKERPTLRSDDVGACEGAVAYVSTLRRVAASTATQWELLNTLVQEKAQALGIVLSD